MNNVNAHETSLFKESSIQSSHISQYPQQMEQSDVLMKLQLELSKLQGEKETINKLEHENDLLKQLVMENKMYKQQIELLQTQIDKMKILEAQDKLTHLTRIKQLENDNIRMANEITRLNNNPPQQQEYNQNNITLTQSDFKTQQLYNQPQKQCSKAQSQRQILQKHRQQQIDFFEQQKQSTQQSKLNINNDFLQTQIEQLQAENLQLKSLLNLSNIQKLDFNQQMELQMCVKQQQQKQQVINNRDIQIINDNITLLNHTKAPSFINFQNVQIDIKIVKYCLQVYQTVTKWKGPDYVNKITFEKEIDEETDQQSMHYIINNQYRVFITDQLPLRIYFTEQDSELFVDWIHQKMML